MKTREAFKFLPLKTAADYTALLFVRSFVGLMMRLPRPAALGVARFCIRFLLLLMPRWRGVGLRNLELVFPHKTEKERRAILSDSFEVLARNLLAFARLPRMSKEEINTRVDTDAAFQMWSQMQSRRTNNAGLLILALHFGAFELLAQSYIVRFRPTSILAHAFGLPRLDAWWCKRREVFGGEVFERTGGYQQMVKRLNRGQDVAVLCDQNVKRNHATFIKFLGQTAATTKAPALAALRTGAQIVCTSALETSEGRYLVLAEEIPNPASEPGTVDEKVDRFMRRVHEVMERMIYAHPEQWMWIHRRFKTRPPGEKEDIYEGL